MRRLGEELVEEGLISSDQLQEALRAQRRLGGRVGRHLVSLGFVASARLADVLSRRCGVPAMSFEGATIDPAVIALVPADVARKHQVVPVVRRGSALTAAMVDPGNVVTLDDLRFITGCTVEPVVAPEYAVSQALDRYYGRGPATGHGVDNVLDRAHRLFQDAADSQSGGQEVAPDTDEVAIEDTERDEDGPAIRLVNLLLTAAVQQRASDIHIEPFDGELHVRYRIDGVLHHVLSPPARLRDALTSRVKVMAKLDIAERRLPQDGRVRVRLADRGVRRAIDVRVSVLPTLFGERVVLRLLDRAALTLDLSALGFEPHALATFESAIRRPWGMVLVTGPTGSGKTSTLYSAIARLDTAGRNVLTAEDPVEFNLPGIGQLQVRDGIGLTFAAALRSFLRQDPDVVLVGEIRDVETAEMAVKAAMTGHLVLSTLHTNDAPAAVGRLTQMGIAPFLVAGSVHLVCAQRLIRRICAHCDEPDEVPVPALVEAGFSRQAAETVSPRRGRGCLRCHGTGFFGRTGLFEVMEITDDLRDLVLGGAPAAQLRQAALAGGMTTLRHSGLRRVRDGATTLDEVLRETVRYGTENV